ncbi:MAG: sensor domain-containing diguanylate cyclase [Candidatus Caenarcaniphilales bacterium]|jgi:diguanylate cyclase (GGDEF)-like protein|nr:sensor domain-containing diguanylate cyclase [Candidatus Caenarcaniphilales bacterium]
MVKKITNSMDITSFLIAGLKADPENFGFIIEDLFDELVKQEIIDAAIAISELGKQNFSSHKSPINDLELLQNFEIKSWGKLYVENCKDKAIVQQIADQLAIFITASQINQQYFLVKDLGSEIRKTLKPDLALSKIYNNLRNFLDIDEIYFFKKLVNTEEPDDQLFKGYQMIFKNGETNDTEEFNQIVQAQEIKELKFINPSKHGQIFYSKVRGREWGIMVACKNNSWLDNETEIVKFFAEEMATVFSQHELHSESLTTAQREFLLNQITTKIRESLALDQITDTAVQEIAQVMGVETCGLIILDRKMRGSLGHRVWSIDPESHKKTIEILYQTIGTELQPDWHSPTVQKNFFEIKQNKNLDFLEKHKVKALMTTGLFNDLNKELVGIMLVGFFDQNRNWSYDEQLLLEGACKQLEIALTQAAIYQEAQQTKRQMALLHKLSNDIRDSLDVSIVLGQIAKGIGEVLGLNRCFVRRISDKGEILKTDEEFTSRNFIKSSDMIFDFEKKWIKSLLASNNAEVLNLTSLEDKIDDPKILSIINAVKLKSILAVPLIARGKLLGTINVHQCDRERTFLAEEIEFIYRVSSEAAIALEHAALFDTINKFNKIDADTGLYNKKYFRQVAEQEIAKCSNKGKPISYMLIDMDFLKDINDDKQHGGHHAGDEAIQILSKVLSNTVRQTPVDEVHRRVSDVVGRFGGDEFMILLPNTSLEDAIKVAERIMSNLKKAKHSSWPKPLSCSIGISASPNQSYDYELLKNTADKALYLSKDKGRNAISSTLELQ